MHAWEFYRFLDLDILGRFLDMPSPATLPVKSCQSQPVVLLSPKFAQVKVKSLSPAHVEMNTEQSAKKSTVGTHPAATMLQSSTVEHF